MKQTCWMTFFVALCMTVGGFVSQTTAQGLPQFVAVVDVAQLIKEHPEFRGKQEALQEKVRAEEAKFRARQQQITDKDKALQTSAAKPGTPEHQRQVDEIANEYADFEKDVKTMQRKFALENSKIMYDTYQDIKKVIGEFAKKRNIAQVTDYRVFEVNPAEPQLVAEDMDQKLVWFDDRLNVTELVINELYAARNMQRPPKQQQQANAGRPATPAAAPAPAQATYSQPQGQGIPAAPVSQSQPAPVR
ncbi:MAG: OmpH family outer membrane protein [Planctomycetaceae bacterium]|nr:OmpH family outer membrane protein [Planctomycetaceae bacterium]